MNEENKTSLAKDIFDILELFGIVTAIFMILFIIVFKTTVVDGTSMTDTLKDGEILIVNEIGYTPQKGDIVVAQNISLTNGLNVPLVKRVIATAGDTLSFNATTKTVTLNGEVLDEPYAKYVGHYYSTDVWDYPITIPEGYVFLMGDNRFGSTDSRSKYVGLVDERCVVGKVIVNFEVPQFLSRIIKNK